MNRSLMLFSWYTRWKKCKNWKIVKIVFISRRSLVYFENLDFSYNCFDSRFHTFSKALWSFLHVETEKKSMFITWSSRKRKVIIGTSWNISDIDKFFDGWCKSIQNDGQKCCDFSKRILINAVRRWRKKSIYLFIVVPISLFNVHLELGGDWNNDFWHRLIASIRVWLLILLRLMKLVVKKFGTK